jgi:ABC-2 type transport system ATP-binding protein
MVLSVSNISKSYKRLQALKNISFSVPEGSVFGILGPNGSGKTTTLGIVLDVLKADAGNFSWFGQQGNTAAMRKKIGSLLETPNFYNYLTAEDNLRITQKISGRGGERDIADVLKKVNLYERRFSPFKTFSLGMKQRLAVGAALLGNPGTLVLDEPTNGLDPAGIAETRSLITELKAKGHTIILASHLLDEVEKVCTHVAILKTGEILASGSVEELLSADEVIEIGGKGLKPEIFTTLVKRVEADEKNNLLLLYIDKEKKIDPEAVNRFCFEKGIVLSSLNVKKKRLEERFFELTKE